jgi:hypothetical protein
MAASDTRVRAVEEALLAARTLSGLRRHRTSTLDPLRAVVTVSFGKTRFPALYGILNDETLEFTVPQFIAEGIRLQAFWLISLAKQDGTHSVLNVWHDYQVVQPDSVFRVSGAFIFAFKVRVAADTGKLAAHNV